MTKTLFFIFLIFIIVLQIHDAKKTNNKFDILQVDNPNKDEFENVIRSRSPTISTNVSKNFFDLQKMPPKNFYSLDKKSRTTLEKNLKEHFSYYTLPLSVKNKFEINVEEQGSTNRITKSTNGRLLICQLVGLKKLLLFSPDQGKYLYLKASGNISKLNFFTDDLLQFPLIAKTKYIEILLYPGQMLYIPKGWFYTYVNEDESFSIKVSSDTPFSVF